MGSLSLLQGASQGHWGGQPFPSPGDLPNPGSEPRSPALRADSVPAEPPGKPKNTGVLCQGTWKAGIIVLSIRKGQS